ncbi:MAG: ketopantoate reductase family protein [Chloroflexi bacterium]|nr:ketopantoate reductase family protein [Chloroflexota bacterium]
MHILVIGGGAIGCFVSARLAAIGQQVALLARPRTAAAIRERGVRVDEPGRRLVAESVRVYESVDDAFTPDTDYDLAVVAVKSYDTEGVAQMLATRLAAGTPTLTLQNGVGNEETLAALASASPILAGVLTTPVETVEPAWVRVARPAYYFAVAPGPRARDVAWVSRMFAMAGFSAHAFADYRALKWSKLLMNMLANAQAAILDYTPAQIFARRDTGELEIRAWREALDVMEAMRIRPLSLAGYPLPLAARLARHAPLGLSRRVFARFIAGGRGDKPPSLYYDVRPRSRGRSEVLWLNGAVADAGARLGVATPVNRVLTTVLLDLVEGRDDPAAWRHRPERLFERAAPVDG